MAATLGAGLGADVPGAILFQGVLLAPGGEPLPAPVSLRFRIFRGGDATTSPSTGILAYHERATVPLADGAFSHLIGTGIPASDCAAGPCVLDATVFGSTPTWIEVTIDPDGVAGTSDDQVLLPRNPVGTVGYAYRVATLDGATGGIVGGNLPVSGTATASALAATAAITGPNVTSGVDPGHAHTAYEPEDADLDDLADGTLSGSKVEPAAATVPGAVTTGLQTFAGWKTFSGKVTLGDETTLTTTRGFVQQAAATFPGGQFGGSAGAGVKIRSYIYEPLDIGSDAPGSVPGYDTEFIWIGPYYNALLVNPLARENPNDYSLGFQFTAGWTHLSGGRQVEYYWRHITTNGTTTWYPFAWNIVHMQGSAPRLDSTIRTSPTRPALQINDTAVSVLASPVGKGELELSGGSGTLYLGGSTGGRLKFEGPTVDEHQLEITAANPTATRTQEFRDASGVTQVVPLTTQNAGTVLWGTSDPATNTGAKVCTLAGLVCVQVVNASGQVSNCSAQFASGRFLALCRS
jgi:hypothetical protein